MPDFQRPEWLPKSIHVKAYSRGSDTPVVELKNIPDFAKKEFPHGWLMKERSYQPSAEWSRGFGDDYLALTAVYAASRIAGKTERSVPNEDRIATIIHERHLLHPRALRALDLASENDFTSEHVRALKDLEKPEVLAQRAYAVHEQIRNHFSDHLPDLVVHSAFVLGKNKRNKIGVYEIQGKVPIVFDLSGPLSYPTTYYNMASRDWKADVQRIVHTSDLGTTFSRDQIQNLQKQLQIFIKKSEEFVEKNGKVLDIFGIHNFVISQDGTLKLLDTDSLIDCDDIQPTPSGIMTIGVAHEKKKFLDYLSVLRHFAETLSDMQTKDE